MVISGGARACIVEGGGGTIVVEMLLTCSGCLGWFFGMCSGDVEGDKFCE